MPHGTGEVSGSRVHSYSTSQQTTDTTKTKGTSRGRGIEVGKSSPKTTSHIQSARQSGTIHVEKKPLDRAQVEKAIPSAKLIFDANERLKNSNLDAQHPGKVAFARAEVAITHSVELLTGEIPMGGPDLNQAKHDLGQCADRLASLAKDIDGLIAKDGAYPWLTRMKATINDALGEINNRKTYLENFEGSHSLSPLKVGEAKIGWAEAACRVIDKEIAKLPGGERDPRSDSLEKLKVDILNSAIRFGVDSDPNAAVEDGGNLKTVNKDLGKEIANKLKELGIKRNEKTLAKDVYEEHITVLNEREWDPIHGDIQFVHDGVAHNFQSDITPAAHMGPLKSSYDGKGICCQARSEANHMVNMATTTLKGSDGKELFSGIRHGIVSAFGIKTKAGRLQANEARAKELMLGVLASKPEMLKAAMNQKEGQYLDLDLTSINLLTPDPVRYFLGGRMSGGTDRAITRDQLNTLEKFHDEPLELKFKDEQGIERRTVRIRPNIAAFSFGVNEGATKDSKAGTVMYYAGGKASFDHVRKDNARAMERLIGDPKSGEIDPDSKIGKFLNNPKTTETDKAIAIELRNHILNMWNNDNYMAHGGDPHKMVSRIAVLTHLIGQTPCFNCKSGKDRTGTLDVEAKFLATRIDFARKQAALENANPKSFQYVPDPGPLSKEDQAIFRQFAIRSGNLEVQEYNTGIGGYKTAAQTALQRRLGTPEAISRFKGGSAHVKA